MTSTPAVTSELDHLDQIGAKSFDGFLVRKDLVRKYSRQYPVPTYVVEFLLGRYCSSTDPAKIEEGLQIVEKQLPVRTVRTGEEELVKARSRDQGSVKIIDIVRARLDTRSDSYAAEVPSLAIKDAQINDELVRANERMLTDGFYAEVSLEYDPVIAQERNGRPFRIAGLRPIQMSNPNVLGILAKGRAALRAELSLLPRIEQQIHAGLPPGHGGGFAVLAVARHLALHLETRPVGGHRVGSAAMHRIELQQVGGGGLPGRIVDMHKGEARAVPEGAERQPADATEAVDADLHRDRGAGLGILDQVWLMGWLWGHRRSGRSFGQAFLKQRTYSSDRR